MSSLKNLSSVLTKQERWAVKSITVELSYHLQTIAAYVYACASRCRYDTTYSG